MIRVPVNSISQFSIPIPIEGCARMVNARLGRVCMLWSHRIQIGYKGKQLEIKIPLSTEPHVALPPWITT